MRTLQDITLSERDRGAVTAAAAALRATLPVARIVLFGSKARGDADAESDIDLLVLTSRPLTAGEKAGVVRTLYPLQLERGVMLSTLEIPLREWEQGVYRVTPLRTEVERDGVAA